MNTIIYRSYLYIDDVIFGIRRYARNLLSGLQDKNVVFSGSPPLSNIDLIKKIALMMNVPDKIPVIHNHLEGENDFTNFKGILDEKVFNFEIRFDMEQGLNKTIAWYKDYFLK